MATSDTEFGGSPSPPKSKPHFNVTRAVPQKWAILGPARSKIPKFWDRPLPTRRLHRHRPAVTWETIQLQQGRSQDLVSGGPTHFGGGGRPPIFRLRPQITRVPPYVLLATPGFRGGGAP